MWNVARVEHGNSQCYDNNSLFLQMFVPQSLRATTLPSNLGRGWEGVICHDAEPHPNPPLIQEREQKQRFTAN
jgi:hypothetical protein